MSEGQIKAPSNYLGSLDGYRALGTFIVVMHHVPFIFIRSPFAYSWWVLQSFFVISGFLLARILIKEKKKGYPFLQYIRNFYVKRLLRIFPLYWACLALLAILLLAFGVTKIPLYSGLMSEYQQNWWLLWTYLYNYKDLANFLQQENGNLSPFLTHLWSLSVEEQFYLMLPLMIFFLSEKNLKRLILAIIILSPVIRLITYFYFNHLAYTPAYSGYFENNDYLKESWVTVIMLRSTWTQLDCLAFGMALAVWDFKWIGSPKKWFYWLFLLFVIIVTVNGLAFAQNMNLQQEMANPYFAYKKAVELFPEWLAKLYIAVSDHHSLLVNYQ
ncbi:MAG TPA: acyltransferase, partial [Chitinophagaceae bacterium]|nr:acyltransferase [Chitinophagaceae bacterium]